SGYGDGALIDLLRLRVSQFRQDRILDELFAVRPKVLERLRELKKGHGAGSTSGTQLLRCFQELERDERTKLEMNMLLSELRRRVRRDTTVILQLGKNPRGFSDIFRHKSSFQNKFL